MFRKYRLLDVLLVMVMIFGVLFEANLSSSDMKSLAWAPNSEYLEKKEATESFKVGNGITIKIQYNRSQYYISGKHSYLNYAHIQTLKKQGNFNSIEPEPDKSFFIVFEPPKSVVNVYNQMTSKKKTFVLIETIDDDKSALPLFSVANQFFKE